MTLTDLNDRMLFHIPGFRRLVSTVWYFAFKTNICSVVICQITWQSEPKYCINMSFKLAQNVKHLGEAKYLY